MSQLPTVAIAGATGNLGPAILKALLDAGIKVTVLTRSSSTNSTTKIPSHPNQTIKQVDFSSLDSLTSALKGNEVVISTIAITSIPSQKLLVDATIAAKATRYITSEFGSDIENQETRNLPVFAPKIELLNYVEEKSKSHPEFTYTTIRNSIFLDWGIQVGFTLNIPEHKATLFNGGNVPFSATSLATVGRTVVESIRSVENRAKTANQAVYIHDTVTTQNKLIELVKKIEGDAAVGNAKEWTTENKSTDDLYTWAQGELGKSDDDNTKNVEGAMFAFITISVWGERNGGDFTGKTWNEKLGIPEKTEAELVELVRKFVTV